MVIQAGNVRNRRIEKCNFMMQERCPSTSNNAGEQMVHFSKGWVKANAEKMEHYLMLYCVG